MKILVPVKRVIDFNVKIRIKPDLTGVETANVKMSMNPFDEIALEEAIRLKESNFAQEVIAITIGGENCQEILRTALAMGADRAILLKTDSELQPLAIAKLLKVIVEQQKFDLVIMGKQAIDDDCNQTGQMLAALLNWPQGTFISKLTIKDKQIEVVREIDGGLETLLLNLPAVVTTDLRLNQPRYVTLPNIMKAKQKPLEKIPVENFNIDTHSHLLIKKVESPSSRKRGMIVSNAKELIDKLKSEAKVL